MQQTRYPQLLVK